MFYRIISIESKEPVVRVDADVLLFKSDSNFSIGTISTTLHEREIHDQAQRLYQKPEVEHLINALGASRAVSDRAVEEMTRQLFSIVDNDVVEKKSKCLLSGHLDFSKEYSVKKADLQSEMAFTRLCSLLIIHGNNTVFNERINVCKVAEFDDVNYIITGDQIVDGVSQDGFNRRIFRKNSPSRSYIMDLSSWFVYPSIESKSLFHGEGVFEVSDGAVVRTLNTVAKLGNNKRVKLFDALYAIALLGYAFPI